MPITRREAREQAFFLIFEWEFHKHQFDEMLINASIGRQPELDDYARNLVSFVIQNIQSIDDTITVHSTKWKKNRIGKVALACLRLCVGELSGYTDVPESVAINEAVELCKKYATEQDSSFINGVLGAVANNINPKPDSDVAE